MTLPSDTPLSAEPLATWWKLYGRHAQTIEQVRVVKSTEKTVTLAASKYSRERRTTRLGMYDSFYPTFAEAQAAALKNAERWLESARAELQRAQGHHGNVKGWRCPEGTW